MNRGNGDGGEGVGAGEGEGVGPGPGPGPGGYGRGGVNLPALRGHNEALLLDLLRGAGPAGLGRTELAARTGLTPQAVSKITARLGGEGLIAEAGRAVSTGGKPRTLLRLVPQARYAAGVHLDRDELRAVRVDLAGTVVAESGGPLDFGAGPDAVVEEVVRALARVGDPGGRPVLGVGVAAPGPLDHRAGVMGRVTGFPRWEGFPLRKVLAARLGVPVLLDKDTNAGAAAAAAGGFRGASVYVHVGTGLGAGLRLGGEVYRGGRSGAGEFGHQVLLLDGPPCRCGARGCAEVLCLAAVARGDLAEAARIVGEGAANLVGLLDVERVVLGGRVVAGAPEVFLDGVRRVIAGRAAGGGPGSVCVALAGAGVAEGAAELVLGPVFGRAG
ncbi:ROK family transcriptional regulator [Streptomyces sp. IBSNAI002]|uniref:ROK family transcriptional regulator n=1 Tax=Streptomyces sp. IBSNAI002 TaxID=3457500 RepID=UPI003FD5C1FB